MYLFIFFYQLVNIIFSNQNYMKYPPINTIHPFYSQHTHQIKKAKQSPTPRQKLPARSSYLSNSGPSTNSKTTNINTSHYEFKEGEMMGGYRIVRKLGEGTFGRVIQGERKGHRYAIKVIRQVPKYIESAKIEKEIIKTINRKDCKDEEGIVRYKHSFYHEGYFCLVFNPLGSSLYELIKKNNYRGFPLKMVQSFFKQILETLAFIHRLGYTHTDLKPQNILLEKQELLEDTTHGYSYFLPKSSKIRIIDFGGATLFNQTHSTIICTRQYRPPEVILQCCQWNQLADVWSIGCIIAQLLTGDLLFPTSSDIEHLLMIEKNSGKFPHWMINKTANSGLRRLFHDGVINESQADRQLEHWQNINSLKTSDQIIQNESLRELVRMCLQIDPNRRVKCSNALQHRFFKQKLV